MSKPSHFMSCSQNIKTLVFSTVVRHNLELKSENKIRGQNHVQYGNESRFTQTYRPLSVLILARPNMGGAGRKNFGKFCRPFYTAKWLYRVQRLAVLTVKGTVEKGFSPFLQTWNKGKGGSTRLKENNGLHRSIRKSTVIILSQVRATVIIRCSIPNTIVFALFL